MATLKACIVKKDMRRDKTWRVQIRLTHCRKVRMISTSMYVTRADLTSAYEIKNEDILEQCREIISGYKEKILSLDLDLIDLDVDEVKNALFKKDKVDDVEFFAFARRWIEKEARPKARGNYTKAVNKFELFVKKKHGRKTISCNEISCLLMLQFEKSLRDEGMLSKWYCCAIKKLFTEARLHYNDNAEGRIVITRSLDLFIPKQDLRMARKCVLEVEKIREIQNVGDVTVNQPRRRDLARDVFLISFLTMGTTAIDLYECELDAGGNITYERSKVRDRRSDRARIVIRPHSVLKPLMEKYANPDYPRDRHAFRFYQLYSRAYTFRATVEKGLKELGKTLGISGLNLYGARHSMATIALNEVFIDKLTVHEMLNHKLPRFHVTDVYIRKDFDKINRANFKLLDYVFQTHSLPENAEIDKVFFDGLLAQGKERALGFRYRVKPADMNADRTWNVTVEVSLGSEIREIRTSIKVSRKDINADYNIKSHTVLDRCNALLDNCRKKTARLDIASGSVTMQQVLKCLMAGKA